MRRLRRWIAGLVISLALGSAAAVIPASVAAADTLIPGVGVTGPVSLGQTSKTQYYTHRWTPCTGRPAMSYDFQADWSISVTSGGVTVSSIKLRVQNRSPVELILGSKVVTGGNGSWGAWATDFIANNSIYNRWYYPNRYFTWTPSRTVYLYVNLLMSCEDLGVYQEGRATIVFELTKGF